eukprot:4894271-Ditylum_brightwellii.AAC.1
MMKERGLLYWLKAASPMTDPTQNLSIPATSALTTACTMAPTGSPPEIPTTAHTIQPTEEPTTAPLIILLRHQHVHPLTILLKCQQKQLLRHHL